MKKNLLNILIALLLSTNILAQTPQGISHQAVIRDAQGKLVASKTIGMQVSILQGVIDGTAVYVETHDPESNVNGLVTYVIGKGTVVTGVFADIDWSEGPFFLKTEVDPTGGMNYSIEGTTQLLSVPYALHANSAKGPDLLEARLAALEKLVLTSGTFTDDRDGNTYKWVRIGDQVWMAEDLKYLPFVVGLATGSETEPYYYVYAYNGTDVNAAKATANYQNYGVLYNWPAAMNGALSSSANPSEVQGACPTGWHLPSDAEWTQLIDYVVSQGYPNSNVVNGAGNALKSCRQVNSPLGGDCNTSAHPRWESDATHYGTDEFGFEALPGGYRATYGSFYHLGSYGRWWSATENSSTTAWRLLMYYDYGNLGRYYDSKAHGFSLRCVRDN